MLSKVRQKPSSLRAQRQAGRKDAERADESTRVKDLLGWLSAMRQRLKSTLSPYADADAFKASLPGLLRNVTKTSLRAGSVRALSSTNTGQARHCVRSRAE